MADPDKIARFTKALEDGTMDRFLQSGEWTQERYDRNVAKLAEAGVASALQRQQGQALGMPNQFESTPAPGAPRATPAPASKEQVEPNVRPSVYVAGVGDALPEDGGWWDEIRDSIPPEVRDFTLMPSRSAVWFEPSDAEVDKLLNPQIADANEGTAAKGNAHVDASQSITSLDYKGVDFEAERKRMRDAMWNDAYDKAQARGESIYRGRDITETSPSFLRTAKSIAESEMLQGIESAARGFDRALTGGMLIGDSDTAEYDTSRLKKLDDDILGAVGIGPLWGETDEERALAKDASARKVNAANRITEANPVANMAGNMAGALAPGGLTGNLSQGATRLMGAEAAKGAVSGFAKGAGAAFAGDFAAEMAAQEVEDNRRSAVGAPDLSLFEKAKGAGLQAAVSGVAGGALNIPGSVSRGMRTAGDADASALATLEDAGGATDFFSTSGVRPPPEHEGLAAAFPVEGAYAGAKENAARAITNDIMPRSNVAGGQIFESSQRSLDAIASDSSALGQEIRSISNDVVSRGERLDRAVSEQSAALTKRFMDRANARIQDDIAKRAGENEAMLQAEGSPAYRQLPGPQNHIGDMEEAIAREQEGDLGLETQYPSVSADRIINKHFGLLQRMAFDDGVNIPNSPSQKFKKAIDSLFRKKTVTAEEAPLYKDVAYEMREVVEKSEGGLLGADGQPMTSSKVEVLLPRRLSARELDNFIKVTDEMSKFPNSPAPEAMRFREVGAVATELREEAFSMLSGMKKRHNLDILEDERMYRSLGLQRNTDELNSMDVDQVTSVMNNIKTYATTPDEMLPKDLAVPRREFEKWLANHDDGLFDEYMSLRDLGRQKRAVNDFGIEAHMTPAKQAAAYQTVEDMITGKDRQYDAVIEAFGASAPRIKAARLENTRQQGLFSLLGVDSSRLTPVEMERAREKMHQIVVDGTDEFNRLRMAMKPEQREILDVAQKAASDVDGMMNTLGFTRDRNRPRWATSDQPRIQQGVFDILENYQKFGSSQEFNRKVDDLFAKNPEVRSALTAMKNERAFQYLMRQTKDASGGLSGSASSMHWYVTAKDFFKLHMDAMMGHKQHGLLTKKAQGTALEPWMRSPVGAPAEYAGVATDTPDRDNVGDIRKMSATKMLQGLMEALSRTDRRPQ